MSVLHHSQFAERFSMSPTATTNGTPGDTVLANPAGMPATLEPDLTSEKFVVKLSEREWTVDVGQTAALQVTIINADEWTARFNIEVEGLDPEWVILSSSEVRLTEKDSDRDSETISILITPPRSPASRAGTHVFSIVVSSPEYGQKSRMGVRLDAKGRWRSFSEGASP